jgi:hypothetical protein
MNISHSAESILDNSESNCEEFHYGEHYNRHTTAKTYKNVQFGVTLSKHEDQLVPNGTCHSSFETTV